MDSEDAEEDRIRRKHPKDVERYIAWLRSAERPPPPRPRMAPLPSSSRQRRRSWDDDADAEGEIDPEGDAEDDSRPSSSRGVGGGGGGGAVVVRRPHPVGLADLDSPAGRRAFISASVSYLFATTYESTDDMSISALLTYLNAAMPQDKHEDFDTTEVVKAITALHERGRVVLQGDILRLCD